MIAASKDKNIRDHIARSQSAKTERDTHRVCPSKLSKRELEDLYFSLMDTNMELKKTVNLQQDNIKMLNTKVNRLMTAQRTAKETSCCAPTKAIVLEQKDTISDLKKANERMSERIRILNMRLCSAKQFLKRCPSQNKCFKCCIAGPSASLKNSSVSVLHSKRCESEHKGSSTDAREKEPVSSRTVETETDEQDPENVQPICKENRCRSLIEELKKKITDLQEESSKHHADYSNRISRLENEMAALQAENERVKLERAAAQQGLQLKGQREQQLAEQLRASDAQCNEIASQWLIEKGKVAELETRAKAADMANQAAKALVEKHSKTAMEEAAPSQPAQPQPHVTSPPTSDCEDTPKAGHSKKPQPKAKHPQYHGHLGCTPSYLTLMRGAAPAPSTSPSPAKSKHSDDSGYNDNPRISNVDDKEPAATPSNSASPAKAKHSDESNINACSTPDDKALAKINKELGKKITDLQEQLDSLRIASVSLKNEQIIKSAESKVPVEICSDDGSKQEVKVCCKDPKNMACKAEASQKHEHMLKMAEFKLPAETSSDDSPKQEVRMCKAKCARSGKAGDFYCEMSTKETETFGSPIHRANEIWSRFSDEGVQQRGDKIQFQKSNNKRSSVDKRDSVSSGSRQGSPAKISEKDPTKDGFSSIRRSSPVDMPGKVLSLKRQCSPETLPDKELSSTRRSSSGKISSKDGLSTNRQTSIDKTPDKELLKDGLNSTRRYSGENNMQDKDGFKLRLTPSPVKLRDKIGKDFINERSMGNTEQDEIVDKIEEMSTIKAPQNKAFARDKANSVKTDADDISERKVREKFTYDAASATNFTDVNKDVQTQDSFDHRTQEPFTSDSKRQTDFVRNVTTQDAMKRDSKTKEEQKRERKIVNKLKRDAETQDNSQRDVETQEDRYSMTRDEYNRECKRQDVLKRKTNVQDGLTGGVKIQDEVNKFGDDDTVCENKPLDIDKNATRDSDRDQAVQYEPLKDIKKEKEKKTTQTQGNSDEDSGGSDSIHSPVVSTAMPSRPVPQGTRRVSIAKCCVPTDDTDHEISHLSDLPPEHDGKSPRELISPGEQRTTTTYTDTYTEPSSDLPTLSEGEMLVRSGRRRSLGEAKDEAVEAQTEAMSVSQKMEEALHSIGEELARCRELLQNQRNLEFQQKPTKDAGIGCPSHVTLRHAPATSQLAQPGLNKCTFTLHIGTLVLSDEAVVYSKDKSLLLTWKFYEQSVAMTRMRSGRVVLFDFTTEYDAEMDERLIDYLKYEEMKIVVCELNKQNYPFASCALPLRDVLLNANHRVDMSLAMTMGPDMRRALSGHSADTLVSSDEVGVLDLWCMLRKRPSQTDQRAVPTLDTRSDSDDFRMTYSMSAEPPYNADQTKRDKKQRELIQATQPTQLLDDSSLAKYTIRPSTVIANEVPTNIRCAGEMKQAVDKNAEQNNMQSITGLEKLEEDVLSNQQPQSISSWTKFIRRQSRSQKKRKKSDRTCDAFENLKNSWKPQNKEFKFNTPTSSYSYIEEPPELCETAGSGTSKKSVTILPRNSKLGWEQPQQDAERIHEQPKETIDITIQWLALNEECGAMTDPTVQRLYVAYSLLGRSGAELETPVSLPKPKTYIEKCVFNFRKSIQVRECDLPTLGHMARCKSNNSKIDPKDCIVFTVISEPSEDPLGLASCEDIGYAYLYLGDVLSYSAGSDTYTEVIAVRSALRDEVVCGVLCVQIDGLEVVRKAKLSASFKY